MFSKIITALGSEASVHNIDMNHSLMVWEGWGLFSIRRLRKSAPMTGRWKNRANERLQEGKRSWRGYWDELKTGGKWLKEKAIRWVNKLWNCPRIVELCITYTKRHTLMRTLRCALLPNIQDWLIRTSITATCCSFSVDLYQLLFFPISIF